MQNILNLAKEHWGKGIFIAVIVLTFGYVGLSQYKLSYPDQTNVEPLSTRGLPVPETDVPVVLPPDPGEAGKLTLEGIDSNNDGVRDDLEREIVYMYPQNEEVRRVLRAMVKKGQDVITTTGDHEHFKGLMVGYFAFSSCYDILIFGPRLAGYNSLDTDKLWNLLKNTPEREKQLYENSYKATPYATTVGSVNSCKDIKGQY